MRLESLAYIGLSDTRRACNTDQIWVQNIHNFFEDLCEPIEYAIRVTHSIDNPNLAKFVIEVEGLHRLTKEGRNSLLKNIFFIICSDLFRLRFLDLGESKLPRICIRSKRTSFWTSKSRIM
jgi:hypothetical protein